MGFSITDNFLTRGVSKFGNEAERWGKRIVKDPLSVSSLGISHNGGTGLGIAAGTTTQGLVGKGFSKLSGAEAIQDQLDAEQEQAEAENAQAITRANSQRQQQLGNMAASQGAKVRLGKPSSTLGIGKSGVQL